MHPVHAPCRGLEEEFFLQGDREKSEGLAVSPLFDRNKPGVTKSQVGYVSV
jgi:cAMP-specific phosphodiesterase 4